MKKLFKLTIKQIVILLMCLFAYTQAFSQCYYCDASTSNCTDEYIGAVEFGDIYNWNWATSNGVYNYTYYSTDVNPDVSYYIFVYSGHNIYSSDYVSVFIDWNQDCDFYDDYETIPLTNWSNGQYFDGYVYVPMTASPGPTRMRVRMTWASAPAPCGSSSYGEVEDYTVNVIPPVTLTTLPLAETQFCGGNSFQVSYEASGPYNLGNVFTAQISDQFGNFSNPTTVGSLTSTGSGTIDCTIPTDFKASDNYYIRVISSEPSINGSSYGPIAIYQLPVAYRVIGKGSYCVDDPTGSPIELDNSQANTLYQLKLNGNNLGSPVMGTGNTISFGNYKAEGSYTIEATSQNGCKNMMVGTVHVKKIPLPTVYAISGGGKFYNEPGNGTYCDGEEGVAIGMSNSDLNVEYTLKFNGKIDITTVSGTGSGLSFGYFTQEGTYTATAISTEAGCPNNMSGSITVRKIPSPQKYTITTSGKYCEGEAGVDISLNGSQAGVLYQLQFNGENLGDPINGTGSSISFGFYKNEGIYTIVATSTSRGCLTQMIGEVNPQMVPKPVAYDITGIDHFCEGSEGSEITISNSEVGVMYQLLLDGSPIGNPILGTGSSISFGKQNIAGLYTIEAASIEGNCTNEMNGSINLKAIPSPVVSITGNMSAKFGSNENYTDESASEGDQYVWTVLGGEINGSNTSASINVNWGNNKTGKVRVTKTNSYGCTSTSEVDINLINNVVTDFEVDKIKGEVPLTVNFTDKSEGYITYHNWDFGDGYSSPVQNPSHVYKIPGKYTVKLTVGYEDVFIDKIKTDLITAENVLSIDESSANLISRNGITISAIEPNPSSDVIRFTYGVNTPQNISIAIYNIYGERVMAISDGYISEGTYNKEMDISNLPSGAYYLQILGKDGQVNQMISIVR
ncbi:MAG: GEVED domain-containing protein [Chloroherpetonaceae bacterium]